MLDGMYFLLGRQISCNPDDLQNHWQPRISSNESELVQFFYQVDVIIEHLPRTSKRQTGFQDVPGSEDCIWIAPPPPQQKRQNKIPCFFQKKMTLTGNWHIWDIIGTFAFAVQHPQGDALMKLPLAWVPRNSYLGIPTAHLPKAGVIYHFQLSIDPVLIVCDAPEGAWLSVLSLCF